MRVWILILIIEGLAFRTGIPYKTEKACHEAAGTVEHHCEPRFVR